MYQSIYIDKDPDSGESVVHLWGDGRNNDLGYNTFPYSEFAYAYKKDPKGDLLSLYGDKIRKVFNYEESDPNLFESDVPRETRILVDKYLDDDQPSEGHRILFFDIEVSMEKGIPDPMKGNNEITSIAYVDMTTMEKVVLLLDKDSKFTESEMFGATIYPFETEYELLSFFLDRYSEIAPSVISHWNGDAFDIPYLFNRIKRELGPDEARRLSPIGRIKYHQFKEKYIIAGVSSLDYMSLYKTFTYNEQPSFRLDAIGKVEVDMGKIEYDGTLDALFKNDPETFVKYNLRDVDILVALDKKLRFIELAMGICHVGHVPYEEFQSSTKYIEGTILVYLHKKGIIAPDKPVGGREKMDEMISSGKKGFIGAYVKEPVPGLYEWVYSLDLQSLYPSVIMSLNISPETKIAKVLNWDVNKHIKNEIERYQIKSLDGSIEKIDRNEFDDFIKSSSYSVASNGVLFRNDITGIIPEILDVWFRERKEYKALADKYSKEGNKDLEQYYDKRQHIQKIFLNSIYGGLGLPVFRFYDLDNAEAVTMTGQTVITTTQKFVNSEYKNNLSMGENVHVENNDYVIYVDT